ncbi:UNKNOWN [Stylonychia lemnae]|uniref:Uncharacterized protein n=1 Tax=Stylonychia lemnae TaxID=5949 RepID=A0A078B7E9_STYLE|nr:UNKNOWN [Stylonychia lemnae]|eukprot:CDW90141.1 UNKNOWN [Stylonychia lemnae]
MSSALWTKLSYSSYAVATLLGIYGRQRSDFSNDFTYNKYHFGVFVNILSGAGFYLSAKVPQPWQSSALFLLAIGLTSLPGYYEGFKDMKNNPYEGDTSLIRKLGFYSMLLGYGLIVYKHKYMNVMM